MRLYCGSSVSSELSSYYSKRTKSILLQYGCFFWLSTFVNILLLFFNKPVYSCKDTTEAIPLLPFIKVSFLKVTYPSVTNDKNENLFNTGAQLGGMFGRHAIPLYNTYQTENKLKTIDHLMTRTACHPLYSTYQTRNKPKRIDRLTKQQFSGLR